MTAHLRHTIQTALLVALLLTAPEGGLEAASTVDELRRHVEFLASDELLGRETGEPGCRRAEDYIASQFSRFGLKPLPQHDDFFAEYELYASGFDADESHLTLRMNGETSEGRAGKDFRPFEFSGEGIVRGKIVFAGYGITAPELDHDDYANLDVEGKIVLVLRYEPGKDDPTSPFDGGRNSRHALFTTKARTAREHGALAMLLVTGPQHVSERESFRFRRSLRTAQVGDDRDDNEFLAVHIRLDWIEEVLHDTDFSALQRALERGDSPLQHPLVDVEVDLRLARRGDAKKLVSRNVVGMVEGSHPILKDQWLVVGAHHDHLGSSQEEVDPIYNGADDNASGTAVVLELARRWAARPVPPERSLLFVTFSGEELGLLGSNALLDQEVVPVEHVQFMLNLDMVGRNPDEALRVFGDGSARGLRELVEDANRDLDLELAFQGTHVPGNSDHAVFFRRGIPVLFFFSGMHPDYHRVSDHADKLSYTRMAQIAELGSETLAQLCNASEENFPRFIHDVAWLGVELEVDEPQQRTRIAAVHPRSRAERAGLRSGDQVLGMDGEQFEDPHEIGSRLRDVLVDHPLTLQLLRGNEQLDLELVRVPGGYMGIRYAGIDGDEQREWSLPPGEGVRVQDVLKGSPADRGGVREGDILLSIEDRSIHEGNIAERLQQIGAGESVELRLLRRGRPVRLRVTLGARPDAD